MQLINPHFEFNESQTTNVNTDTMRTIRQVLKK